MKDLFLRLRALIDAQPIFLLFLATFAFVAFSAPVKIGLALWGISKLALFAFAGAWLCKQLFRSYAPPGDPGIVEGTLWKLKAWIVAASIVAGALLP